MSLQAPQSWDLRSSTPVAPAAPKDTRRHRGAMAYHAGIAAERAAARHYLQRGHGFVAHRWRGHAGEIDLIHRDGDGLIFIEVKCGRSFDAAAARLTQRQLRRIMASAEGYMGTQPLGLLTPARFDAALVDQTGAVQIIENLQLDW